MQVELTHIVANLNYNLDFKPFAALKKINGRNILTTLAL